MSFVAKDGNLKVSMMTVLYISYDGLLEPLGQSQVLQYLKGLSSFYDITLISYEKKNDWNDIDKREAIEKEIAESGIDWRPLRYHKKLSAVATAYDIFLGTVLALWLVLKKRVRIVHARSYVPSVIALFLKKILGTKYVFDMRGFWADERVDGGLWARESALYKIAKWFEKRFLLNADVTISLTHRAVAEMQRFDYLRNRSGHFEVIPTCVNLNIFKLQDNHGLRDSLDLKGRFVIGYVGSAGTWYLFDEALDCFKVIKERNPDSFLLILNRNEHGFVRERLKRHGISEEDFRLIACDYLEVSAYISSMGCGLFFYKPTLSKMATSPTKLGEFLACGKPIIGNDIGDVGEIVSTHRVGVIVREFSEEGYKKAIEELFELKETPLLSRCCRETAEECFSIERGVRKYSEIYAALLENVER